MDLQKLKKGDRVVIRRIGRVAFQAEVMVVRQHPHYHELMYRGAEAIREENGPHRSDDIIPLAGTMRIRVDGLVTVELLEEK